MMATSKIEWTERVWNPLTGCTRIGQGCVNCYAERMSHRLAAMGRLEYLGITNDKGNWNGEIKLLFSRLDQPLHWKKPSRIFVNSMSDLFHKNVPNSFIHRVVTTMQNAPQHQFQVLTKRYDRPFLVLYPQDASDNILIGFSICNQSDADDARQYLRFVSEMGWRTWVSYEPALEQINWQGWEFIEWLVCGGESGPGARPMHPDWARSARDFCAASNIPFFFKQWGGARKKKGDHVLDDRTHLEYPPLQPDRQSLPE